MMSEEDREQLEYLHAWAFRRDCRRLYRQFLWAHRWKVAKRIARQIGRGAVVGVGLAVMILVVWLLIVVAFSFGD